MLKGVLLYDTIVFGAAAPEGVSVSRIGRPDLPAADTPVSAETRQQGYVTSVSILSGASATEAGARLQFHVWSPDLKYPVSNLMFDAAGPPALSVGNLTRMLASYCSEPVVFARVEERDWLQIDGTAVWGCGAAPRDNRLWAAVLLFVALGIGLSQASSVAGQFSRFSRNLMARGQFGGHEPFVPEGPQELRDIVETVNSYLADERDRLQKRAMVLSGVSHDLGTPATRLRLRTALIEDDGLREKLESDIDQMTDMIESVLTYTRAEMSAEETVRLSLTALVQSIVADYEDVGEPVQFVDAPAGSIEIGRSVFSGGAARKQVLRDDARRILVTARAISLRRAISNLIDNAVKYGRNAEVSVQADSRIASIVVTDSGQFMTEDELDTLVQPFLRGSNAEHVKGAGLGLTVVATIARQHGGTLRFERGAQGVRAIMTIGRR